MADTKKVADAFRALELYDKLEVVNELTEKEVIVTVRAPYEMAAFNAVANDRHMTALDVARTVARSARFNPDDPYFYFNAEGDPVSLNWRQALEYLNLFAEDVARAATAGKLDYVPDGVLKALDENEDDGND